MKSYYEVDQLISICDLKKKMFGGEAEHNPHESTRYTSIQMNYLISNQQKLNTVKHVLRGHL
jgi:hypothetical protein